MWPSPNSEAALTSVMYYRKQKQAHPEAQRGYGSQWKVGNISKLKSAGPTAYMFSTQKEKEGEGAKKLGYGSADTTHCLRVIQDTKRTYTSGGATIVS